MARKNLAEILKEAEVDPRREYDRLYTLFYVYNYSKKVGQPVTLHNFCAFSFNTMPFKGTCLTLDDFEETHKIAFEKEPHSFSVDYLVFFCEYTYNLSVFAQTHSFFSSYARDNPFIVYMQQVKMVIDLLGYMETKDGSLIIFTPKSPAAVSVAEITDETVSYKILEYNHYSMRGDLYKKLSTLKLLADEIEPKRKKLKELNGSVESELFQMLDKFVRHNNKDNPFIASMSPEEIEEAYDDTYQMWLLAELELDNVERKKRVKGLLGKINL